MKNRKLFAILTLVAFMMTLLPVAAFAADPVKADRFASIVRVDKTSVEADGEKDAEFTVYVRDKGNNPAPVPVYVASERDADVFTADTAYKMTSTNMGDYKIYAFTPDTNGKVEFEVTSTVAGDTEIAVGLKGDPVNNPYEYLTDSDVTAAKAEIIGTKTITFEATKTSDIQLTGVEGRKTGAVADLKASGEKGDREYGSSASGLKIADPVVKANGTDYFELTFQVKNDSNAPVEGERVEFSANKSNVRFNIEEDETDVIGEVEVKVYANKAGTYEIEATVGSDTAKVWLEFAPADVSGLVLAGAPSALVATDEPKPASFKLEFLDASGNRIDPLTIVDLDEEVEFEWIVEPSDSDQDDDYWTSAIRDLSVKDSWANGDEKVKVTNDNLLQLRLPELEEEGAYELKVNIENGKSVTVKFEGREQGDITKLTLSYDSTSIQLNGKSSGATVKRLDKDGVSVELSDSQKKNDIEWSISDYRVLKDGFKDLTSTAGVLNVTDDDDYVGTYTVIAVDKKNDLTATAEITVGKEVIGLEVEVPAGKLPVGEESTLIIKTVDGDGNVIALGKDAKDVEFSYYVTSQPANAKASAEELASEGKFMTDLQNKGEAAIEVYANAEGSVDMVFVVGYKQAGGDKDVLKAVIGKDADGKDIITGYEWVVVKEAEKTYKFTKAVTLDFAEETTPVVIGAKNVTMFIGSVGYVVDGVAATMDQAPFIQDNRTFVPVRMVATALGATNEDTMWDAATQTITLVREDLTVTMTVGSNVLTLSDGTTVVADVAPFIVAETGRTVIPFRAIAEAFGAEVEAVFGADGTTTAVTFTQE